MNYLAVYERLIQRAKRRSLTGVVEIHHIMPKCLGGTNEEFNLVKLTPEEHYTAHQKLEQKCENIGRVDDRKWL